VGTVKIHLHNIYQKLRISGRVRLAGLSRENPARVLDRTQQGEALAR
jgi:DNA-binding NarL/FixJ family response regulator